MKQRFWSKAMALLMTICMVISMSPLTAFAAEENNIEWNTVSSWKALQSALNTGGNVKLGDDITAAENDTALVVSTENGEATKTVTLDLNGHTINRNLNVGTYQGYVIRVQAYSTLTIQDSSAEQAGKITGGYNGDWHNADSAGGGIYVDLNSTLNFAGGQITGNKAYSGGGVYVAGTMNMTGGKIIENEATATNSDGAGGVKIGGGTVKMSAGEISNNVAPRYGAGISVWAGYFEMSGGKISNNTITANAVNDGSDIGGGIYVRESNIVLKGGEVSGNTANKGAGIYLKGESGDASTLTMSNAQISNNIASSSGGGIYADTYSTATLQSGSIYQNTANGSGAGVYFGARSHGVISDISITRNEIKNASDNGAGISASNDVKISGSPRICDNYHTGSNGSYINNIGVYQDALKVVGTLGEKASIGIANGGTQANHYAAVGSDDYQISESDRSKFFSDSAYYSVKPLNTEVDGNCVELGESWVVDLRSKNVTVFSEGTTNGKATLVYPGSSEARVWKDSDFVFTVAPAKGYQKNDNFCVTYQVDNSTYQLTGAENGTYTIPAQTKYTKLYVEGIEKQLYTIKFETGVDGLSIPSQTHYINEFVAMPETTPDRDGYLFAGWYSDAACKQAWNFSADGVSGDMTLYAKWIPNSIPTYTLSGKVVTSDGDGYGYGVIVMLTQDNDKTVVASVTTADDGTFSFTGLPAGTYQVSAVDEDDSVTTAVTIRANVVDLTLTLSDQSIKTEINVEENTPNVYVSGLGMLATVPAYQPASGQVRIVLNVAAKDESDIPADAEKIKALWGNEPLTYLDMNIEWYVNGRKVENITDTGDHVQAITIDYDTAGKNISVYRVHGGTAEKLKQLGTQADGTYRVNDGSITIYTTKFSTYAIGYTTKSSGGHSSSGSAATTYPVDVKSVTNGTIKADKSTASKDSTVTITVTPDKGYELGKLTVTDKNGKTISVTAKGNGQYTFTMPASGITVMASFAETDWDLAYRNCPKDSTCPIWQFTDAKTTDWYHDGVHFCLENGLMVGYGNNIFQPDTGTTRAMIAVMLWRLNGSPVVNYAMNFEDVKADAWYTEAIRWAASEGVAAGYGNGKFGPDDTMTREQMVTILWRYAQYKGYDVSVGEDTNILSYDDATTVAQYAIPAMQWACGSGMVTGKTQNGGMTLAPKGSTTRAQMATMMMRFCAEIVK